jgi:hypothetical protein
MNKVVSNHVLGARPWATKLYHTEEYRAKEKKTGMNKEVS